MSNINITIASKKFNATSITRLHSIKPPKTLLTNIMPLTVYVRKGSENDFESTIKYFIQNDINVNIISNFNTYVKKAFANTIFNNMDDYYETIELLVVAGLTIEKTNKSYTFASIGFRSVKDFTYLKTFNWYNYITSFFKKNFNTPDDELVYKLHKSNAVSYNNIHTTKIYEIVLCATINNQLKYMKKIAFKSLEKIIDLFFDDNSNKTIIVLKSTDQGIKSKIYSDLKFTMTTITNDGLMFMFRQNSDKPNKPDKPNILNSSYINPIIVNK